MMINRRQLLGFAAGAFIFQSVMPRPAAAHREDQSWSEIVWNARTHHLEVIHSFHIHTAEMALADAGIIKRPDLMGLEARSKLALYCAEHFSVTDNGHRTVPLTLVGAEIEGQTAYVYQEASLAEAPTGLIVRNDLLRALVPGLVSYVNVHFYGKVQSLRFADHDRPQQVWFNVRPAQSPLSDVQ